MKRITEYFHSEIHTANLFTTTHVSHLKGEIPQEVKYPLLIQTQPNLTKPHVISNILMTSH